MPGPLTEIVPFGLTKALAIVNGLHVLTMTGNVALDGTYPNVLVYDPDGSDRTITLEAVAGLNGMHRWLKNAGSQGEEITVNDPEASAVVVLGAGEIALVWCNGTAWSLVQHHKLRDGVTVRTATDAVVLTTADQRVQVIDPGGSTRAVTLPAAADEAGRDRIIRNAADGEEGLTFADLGDITLPPGDALHVYSTGAAWAILSLQQAVTRLGADTETLAATKTLVSSDKLCQILDPDGEARDVELPAEALSLGHVRRIVNAAGGAENLVVKDAGANTLATIAQNEAGDFSCDGSAWVLQTKFYTTTPAG